MMTIKIIIVFFFLNIHSLFGQTEIIILSSNVGTEIDEHENRFYRIFPKEKQLINAQFIKIGKEIARVSFENIGKKVTEKALLTAAKKLVINNVDDLLAALGSVQLTGDELIKTLYPKKVTGLTIQNFGERKLSFVGLDPHQQANTASCCKPIPGERIVGITEKNKGIILSHIHN